MMTSEERIAMARKATRERRAEADAMKGPCSECRWRSDWGVLVGSSWEDRCVAPAAATTHGKVSPTKGLQGAVALSAARDDTGFCGPEGLYWEPTLWSRAWKVLKAAAAGVIIGGGPWLLLKCVAGQ